MGLFDLLDTLLLGFSLSDSDKEKKAKKEHDLMWENSDLYDDDDRDSDDFWDENIHMDIDEFLDDCDFDEEDD